MSAKQMITETPTVGEQLKTLFGDMPQVNVADLARVSRASLSMVVNDRVSPTVASLMKILHVTGGSIVLDSGKPRAFGPDTKGGSL